MFERIVRFPDRLMLLAARYESSRTFSEQLQRRIGVLCSWVGLGLTAIPLVRIALNSESFAPWWLALGIICASLVVCSALLGPFLSIRALRLSWISLITIVLASQFLGLLAYDRSLPLDRLWVWEFTPLASALAALLLSFRKAMLYVIASALAVPMSALFFLGEIPFEIIVELPASVANVFFVLAVTIAQQGLEHLKQTVDLRAAAELEAARVSSREKSRKESNRLIHDEVLALLNAALMFKGQSSEPLSEASSGVISLLNSKQLRNTQLTSTVTPVSYALTDLRNLIHHPTTPDHVQLRVVKAEHSVPTLVWRTILAATGEALRNVKRHSSATRVKLILSFTPDALTVTVRDNGVGFDPVEAELANRGVAQSILSRMKEIDGEAVIFSELGLGSEVSLSWASSDVREGEIREVNEQLNQASPASYSVINRWPLRISLLFTLLTVLIVEFWQRAALGQQPLALAAVLTAGTLLTIPIFRLTNEGDAALSKAQLLSSSTVLLLNSLLSLPFPGQWIPWQFILCLGISALYILRGNTKVGIFCMGISTAFLIVYHFGSGSAMPQTSITAIALAAVLFAAALAWRAGLLSLRSQGYEHFAAISAARRRTMTLRCSLEVLEEALQRAKAEAEPVLIRISEGDTVDDCLYRDIWFAEAGLRDAMYAPHLQRRGLPALVKNMRQQGVEVTFLASDDDESTMPPDGVVDIIIGLLKDRPDEPISRCVLGTRNKTSTDQAPSWYVTVVRGNKWELNEIDSQSELTTTHQSQQKMLMPAPIPTGETVRGNSE